MTDFLFAEPSIIEGLGRILDMGNTMQVYNNAASPEEADADALRQDFAAVGNDIRAAYDEYERSVHHEQA